MLNLFLKDESIDMAPAIVGYHILSFINRKDDGKVSLFDITDRFKDEQWFSPKTLYFGMFFLFSVDLIDFEQPYVVKNAHT